LVLHCCIAFDSVKCEIKQYVPGLPVAIQSTAAQNLNTIQTSENQSITYSNTIVGYPLSLNGTGTGDTILGNATGSLTILAGGGLTIDIGALSFANVSAGSGVPLVLGPGGAVYYMPSSMRYKKDISYTYLSFENILFILKNKRFDRSMINLSEILIWRRIQINNRRSSKISVNFQQETCHFNFFSRC
jgi:hypothetical protein